MIKYISTNYLKELVKMECRLEAKILATEYKTITHNEICD